MMKMPHNFCVCVRVYVCACEKGIRPESLEFQQIWEDQQVDQQVQGDRGVREVEQALVCMFVCLDVRICFCVFALACVVILTDPRLEGRSTLTQSLERS